MSTPFGLQQPRDYSERRRVNPLAAVDVRKHAVQQAILLDGFEPTIGNVLRHAALIEAYLLNGATPSN